jgi:hypothetical protein
MRHARTLQRHSATGSSTMPESDASGSEAVLQPPSDAKEDRRTSVAKAIETAKAKNARLRLMKARNENYLAEQRDEHEAEEDKTQEL